MRSRRQFVQRLERSKWPANLLLLVALNLAAISVFAQSHKVPFTAKDNMIFVAAKVNGYPVKLKIDTGATASVFASKLLTVHNAKEIEVRTAGGSVKALRGDARLELITRESHASAFGENAVPEKGQELSRDQKDNAGAEPLKFRLTATYLRDFIDQGVIGIDVLGQFRQVIFDFKAKEIEFVPYD